MSVSTDEALSADFRERCSELLSRIDGTGHVYARNLVTGRDLGLRPDALVVAASVFKIAVLVELYRQVAAGEVDLSERHRIGAAERVFGATGLSCFQDDAELSLRDLAQLMISVSDNTATDAVLRRVGLDRVNATMRELGHHSTCLVGDCAHLLGTLMEDLALQPGDDPTRLRVPDEQLRAARSLSAERTTRTTPREVVELLCQVWSGTAAPDQASAQVRQVLGGQVWEHGLRAGLAPGMAFAGKSGTLPGVRNEAGVVTTESGESVVLGVFLRFPTRRLLESRPDVDVVLAEVGRLAVSLLLAPSPVGGTSD